MTISEPAGTPAARKKEAIEKLYWVQPPTPPRNAPEILWLHAEGLKDYFVHRPVGPLPHPDGVNGVEGSGYLPDWRPAPMVLAKRPGQWTPGTLLPLPDMQDGGGVHDWIVSDRMKAFFEMIDPEAFAFCANEVLIGPDLIAYDGPSYWRCDVVRFLDPIDYERTPAKSETFANGIKRITPSAWDRNYFKRHLVNGYPIFRLEYRPDDIWGDRRLKDSALAAGLSIGFSRTWGHVIDD